ncbi:MAG: hypothetical protein Q4F18_14430, partial [Clostridia bacterium]|nr:hypothetical protein [Clostridia bacterium]
GRFLQQTACMFREIKCAFLQKIKFFAANSEQKRRISKKHLQKSSDSHIMNCVQDSDTSR